MTRLKKAVVDKLLETGVEGKDYVQCKLSRDLPILISRVLSPNKPPIYSNIDTINSVNLIQGV